MEQSIRLFKGWAAEKSRPMFCDVFEGFLPSGATRPFLVRCDDGGLWVAKATGNPLGTKAVLNELVVEVLARRIELPWPRVSLVEFSTHIMDCLIEGDLGVQSKWGIATQFLEGLRQVGWPPEGYYPRATFRERNTEHIRSYFPHIDKDTAFYGKAVFDNWILLEDRKYDTLMITKDGDPLFLDASAAFGGLEWDRDLLKWQDTAIDVKSPYLEGIITQYAQFDPWLERIETAVEPTVLLPFEDLPESWFVPEDYYSALNTFLSGTQDVFVPMFRSWVEFRKMSNNHL